MGLDCVPLGAAKPEFRDEWERIMNDLYRNPEISEETQARLLEISIEAGDSLGAPVIGEDPEADAWAIHNKPADSNLSSEEFLDQHRGYRVFELLDVCDGVPDFSNAGAYDGVDRCSFRGSFLEDCQDIIGSDLLKRAWTDVMRPEEADDYGKQLLEAAAKFRNSGERRQVSSGFLSRLFDRRRRAQNKDMSDEEKLEIIESAGKWYRFWGKRGHPIWAYY